MTTYQATWPGGQTVVWRNLTWAEFNSCKYELENTALENPVGLYVRVYGICRIEGPVPEAVPAGIASWIGKQQLDKCPFRGMYKDLSETLTLARTAVVSNYLLSAKAFIAAAFHIPFKELDDMDSDTFFLRLAQAELVLGRSCTPADPDAKKEPVKKKLGAKELATQRHREQRQREAPSLEVESTNAVRATRSTPATKR